MSVSDDEVDEALLMISEGNSLRHAARELKLPIMSLYYAVSSRKPEHYARARDAAAELDADQVKEVAEDALAGRVDPAAARVAIDALKWTAGKRSPRKFGDKLQLGGASDLDPVKASITVELVSARPDP